MTKFIKEHATVPFELPKKDKGERYGHDMWALTMYWPFLQGCICLVCMLLCGRCTAKGARGTVCHSMA